MFPNEIWFIILSYVWPLTIVNVRLTCRYINNMIMSSGFMNLWPHSMYYNDLMGYIKSDIYTTYDEYLNRSYDYTISYNDPDKIVLLAKVVRYGDLDLIEKLIEKYQDLIDNHIYDWLLECSVRSNSLKMIKLIDNCLHGNIYSWRYALIESIDTDNFEILKYVSLNTGYFNRHYACAHAIRSKKYEFAGYLLSQGLNHDKISSRFLEITPEKINQIKVNYIE